MAVTEGDTRSLDYGSHEYNSSIFHLGRVAETFRQVHPIRTQAHVNTHTYICIYIYLSIYLSMYLSIYLSIYLSMYLCVLCM